MSTNSDTGPSTPSVFDISIFTATDNRTWHSHGISYLELGDPTWAPGKLTASDLQMIEAFNEASKDLGIRVNTAVELEVDGERYIYAVELPEFRVSYGDTIAFDHRAVMRLSDSLKHDGLMMDIGMQRGCLASMLAPCFLNYSREDFVRLLSGYYWIGPGEEPSWHKAGYAMFLQTNFGMQ